MKRETALQLFQGSYPDRVLDPEDESNRNPFFIEGFTAGMVSSSCYRDKEWGTAFDRLGNSPDWKEWKIGYWAGRWSALIESEEK